MPEYSGSLQSFELAVALWLAPLLPLVAAIYSGIGGYIGGGDDSQLPKSFRPRFVALLAGLSALGLIGFHLVVLLGLPGDQRQLVSHAWGMQRIGSLDTSFTFSAEPSTQSAGRSGAGSAISAAHSLSAACNQTIEGPPSPNAGSASTCARM